MAGPHRATCGVRLAGPVLRRARLCRAATAVPRVDRLWRRLPQRERIQVWRTAVGDVTDAGRWLTKQGIADPERLGIFGWSYGGYAALRSNYLDPGLFKTVVAVAPVTNLQALRSDQREHQNAVLVSKFVGSNANAAEGSPVRHADIFKAPVLMFHGDQDLNVDIKGSAGYGFRAASGGEIDPAGRLSGAGPPASTTARFAPTCWPGQTLSLRRP